MKRVFIKGPIIPNNYQKVYDFFDMDATSPQKISRAIEDAKGEEITVEINSGGGDVFSGSEIYTALKSHNNSVTVEITGIAASAASVIAMAGSTVRMSPTAQMMIHNVTSSAEGDHRDMAQASTVLKGANKSIANAYMLKTGKSRKELLSMMDTETWMTAEIAKQQGFIDEVMFDEEGQLSASVGANELPREVIMKTLNELENLKMEDVIMEPKDEIMADLELIEQANARAIEGPAPMLNLETKTIELKEFKKMAEIENSVITADSAEYRNAYLKRLQGKSLTPFENVAVVAASAIPTETMNKIIEKLEQTSVLYPYITTSAIPGNVSIPVEGVKTDAAWVAMGTAATDAPDTFTAITLAAYKLIKTVEIGADVQNMSIDAFESFLVSALAKKMQKAVDNAIVNGAGGTQPTGILAAGIITNTGTFTKLGMDFADLTAQIADLPSSEYRRNAKFVMPSALYFGDVLEALSANGIGVDMQNPLSYKILGYDVILDDYVAEDTVIFGDLSYYHFNWAKAIAIESDASVGFRTGSTVYRAMALADGKVTNPAAFNVYTRALA